MLVPESEVDWMTTVGGTFWLEKLFLVVIGCRFLIVLF